MHSVILRSGADRRSRQGHLWVFSNEIQPPLPALSPGSDVRVLDARGHLVGAGTFHPHTLISVRLHALGTETPLDRDLLERRIRMAAELRKTGLGEHGMRACRVVNAEGDLLPGLIVDRYEEYLSVQCLTAAMENRTAWVLDILQDCFHPAGILLRNDAASRSLEGLPRQVAVARGEVPARTSIRLQDLRFWVDMVSGQKTGFYFDQRENYSLMQAFCEGARVLDAYCFTGAWALHAALWGAREVLGIDSSAPALELANENARENALPNLHFQKGEVVDTLKDFADEHRLFDLIILDPPAYAKSRGQVSGAVKGHLNLHKWALRCLGPGGVLVTCCCSSYVGPGQFLDSLVLAARHAGHTLRVLAARGQGLDHPWVPAMPETAYLKVLQVQAQA